MLLHIPAVLTPVQLAEMRAALASADWIDGRATVGAQGAQVKRNQQLADRSPLATRLGETVLAALSANPLFHAATLPARILPPIAHEPTSRTGLLHKAGAISMARNAPGTAVADFSILLSDMPGLDADPASADPEKQAGYAVFGYVVSGMDVVRQIWDAPRSSSLGEGVMKGQMLDPPVKVLTARRVPIPAAAVPAF